MIPGMRTAHVPGHVSTYSSLFKDFKGQRIRKGNVNKETARASGHVDSNLERGTFCPN